MQSQTPIAANPSRWMTDNWETIKHLKMHELLLPGAHHSGFDQDNSSPPAETWGACQDYDCYSQLCGGVRVLDLRMKDLEDNSSDRFQFFHGGFSLDRYARHCGDETRRFLNENPGEIVIIDFHELRNGPSGKFDFFHMLRYFPTEKGIPVEATNLTLAEIRAQYPDRNIVFASNNQITHWNKIQHAWSKQALIDGQELVEFVKATMANPPLRKLWSLSATGYILTGPERIHDDHPLWDAIFDPLQAPGLPPFEANIINVDFYQITGVVNRCIEISKQRGIVMRDSQPKNFKTAQIWSNGVSLTWSAPYTDPEDPIYHYVLTIHEDPHIETAGTTQLVTDLTGDTEYSFVLYAVTHSGKYTAETKCTFRTSASHNPRPGPHKPLQVVVSGIKENGATLQWESPNTGEPVASYLVTEKGGATVTTSGNYLVLNNLNISTEYKYEVRSKDAQGRLSDRAEITFRTIDATLLQPTNIRTQDVTSSAATIKWQRPTGDDRITGYQFSRNGIALFITTDLEYRATWLSHSRTYAFAVRSRDQHGNLSIPAECSVTTANAPTRPGKPTHLKLETQSTPKLVWSPPSIGEPQPANYIIYLNGKQWAAALLPICVIKLPEVFGEDYCYDVCSNDLAGQLSDPATIIIEAPKPQLSAPGNLDFIDAKDTSGVIQWSASSGNVNVIAYELIIGDRSPIQVNSTSYKAEGLEHMAPFDVKVRAVGPNGYYSPFSSATFSTKAWITPPGRPEVSQISRNSAYVSWAPSTGSHPIKGYQVIVWGVPLPMTPETYHQINRLLPGAYYIITVEVEDVLGNRAASESASFMTLK